MVPSEKLEKKKRKDQEEITIEVCLGQKTHYALPIEDGQSFPPN